MKRFTVLLPMAMFSIALQAAQLTSSQLNEILNHSDRMSEDKARDDDRQPAKIMAFSGVSKGDNVLDIYAGGGWYSELYSKAVGPKGKVYAQNDNLTWRFGEKEIVMRTKDERLANIIRLDKVDIADINLPDNSVDIAFMGVNYHDLFFTYRFRSGKLEKMRDQVVDYKASFTTVKKALKDDGVLIIIDHSAELGSGYDAANTLHRMDPNIVKFQLNDVGFVLLEEAFYLRNPNDDLKTLVFDSSIRGKTDRFVYKFGKK